MLIIWFPRAMFCLSPDQTIPNQIKMIYVTYEIDPCELSFWHTKLKRERSQYYNLSNKEIRFVLAWGECHFLCFSGTFISPHSNFDSSTLINQVPNFANPDRRTQDIKHIHNNTKTVSSKQQSPNTYSKTNFIDSLPGMLSIYIFLH